MATRMGTLDQLTHLLNFLAPAFVVGLLLAVAGALLGRKNLPALGLLTQLTINFIAGALTLGLGLWFFGRDGKMASYAAMLVACATSQWYFTQGKRA